MADRSARLAFILSLTDKVSAPLGKVKTKFTDLAILMEDSFQAECKRQGALPVRDFMAPPLKSIKGTMHPLHAAEIMMTENETCLPVVEDGILIGLVRLIDIFHTLAGSCSL